MIGSFVRFLLLTRCEGSLNSLVRFAHSFVYAILHNSWIKIVRTHQPWSNLYISREVVNRVPVGRKLLFTFWSNHLVDVIGFKRPIGKYGKRPLGTNLHQRRQTVQKANSNKPLTKNRRQNLTHTSWACKFSDYILMEKNRQMNLAWTKRFKSTCMIH